jgi:hypothetical protein
MPVGSASANQKMGLRTFREHVANQPTDFAGCNGARMSPEIAMLNRN